MIIEEILRRRSIRAYENRPVEQEKLERVMEAARWAPTSRNSQQWKIIAVRDETIRHLLVDKASPHQQWLKTAPVLLAACSLEPDYHMRCEHPAFLIDLAIVLDHISLQAAREGLGTCWIGSFYQEPAREVLKIPAHIPIVQLMSLGYPERIPQPTPRFPREHFFVFDQWRD